MCLAVFLLCLSGLLMCSNSFAPQHLITARNFVPEKSDNSLTKYWMKHFLSAAILFPVVSRFDDRTDHISFLTFNDDLNSSQSVNLWQSALLSYILNFFESVILQRNWHLSLCIESDVCICICSMSESTADVGSSFCLHRYKCLAVQIGKWIGISIRAVDSEHLNCYVLTKH